MTTRDVRPDDFVRIAALAENLGRLAKRQSATLSASRANGWTDSGIASGEGGPTGIGTPSNPVLAAVLARQTPGATINYRRIIVQGGSLLATLEAALAELTRDPNAALEERETTHTRDSLTAPAGSGTCAACDRHMPGGDDRQHRIITKSGEPLCKTHHDGFNASRNREHWLTVTDYIASIRAQRGLDLNEGAA